MLKLIRTAVRKGRERGSALLMSLMVMVGLSLLGLGFVAISETENAISLNHRNTAQTQALAEAGARAVVEWFQKPEWAAPLGLMPAKSNANNVAFKADRIIDIDNSTPVALVNAGKIKTNASDEYFCCDRPFKPATNDRFYGTENNPDIRIAYMAPDGVTPSAEGTAFLDAFNALLFQNNPGGRITEIAIYAPPIIDAPAGNPNASGFWNHNVGGRYGLATIKATAQQGNFGNPIAQRSVKIIISEWPFPGPQGPIQSNANIQTGGNVVVHWGKMTSQGTMFVKRPLVGIPWHNAYEKAHYEHGYDSSREWAPMRDYHQGDVVHSMTLGTDWTFEMTAPAGPVNSGPVEPAWITAANIGDSPMADATGITWTRRMKTRYPVINSTPYNDAEYLWEIVGKQLDDPWIESRARGEITNANIATAGKTGVAHPFKYTGAAADEMGDPIAGFSNWFQLQTISQQPDLKEVIFPRIDYDFWKNTAISGQGNEGVYYLTWVAGEDYRDNAGVVRNVAQWTNIWKGRPRGFYFFESNNNQNPQIPGGAAFLTPPIEINSSDDSAEWTMSGFIYLNTSSFATQGVAGKDGERYNFPGEPYRDLGHWEVDPSTMTLIDSPLGSGSYAVKPGTASNGKWDYQELNANGRFDLFLRERVITRPGDSTTTTVWLPVDFYDGCTPGTGGLSLAGTTIGSGNCSEPHEPYLNLVYPQDACCGAASAPNPLTAGWEDPNTVTRRPKKRITSTTWASVDGNDLCTDSAQFDAYCTSNGHDRDGYADVWSGQGAPVLDGVLYVEGNFDSTGNARYFGSVLINGNVDSTGTNEVWFDERLIKDEWPPKEWPFPRVIVTAVETDN